MAKKKSTADHGALLKKLLLDIFKEHPYKAYNYKQVIKKLNQEPFFENAKELLELMDEQQLRTALIATLESMSINEDIQEVDRGKYKLWPQSHYIKGVLDMTSNGNAYWMNADF